MDEYKWYPDDYQMHSQPRQPDKSMIVYQPPRKQRKSRPWLVAMVTALITSLVCTGAFTAFLFTPVLQNQIGKLASGSAIIYRDGSDMRNKVDVSGLINQPVSADGKTPLSVVDIARQVGPAVVGIINKTQVNGFLNQTVDQGSGSGIIISADGYIVTNNHVVEGASEVKVILSNKEEYSARLIGADLRTDIAVIKIEASALPTAVLGNSSGVQVGELAVAIGNPLGQELAGSLTTGIISAVNRTIAVDNQEYTLLQTDAAINPGNSGGALVNAYGEVIGINSVKMAANGVEGLGFAIPSDIAKPVINDLIEHGYVQGRPLIGLVGRNITADMSRYYKMPEGIYVIELEPFSGAELGGIKPGDVIVKCNGTAIKTVNELNAIRDQHKAGDTVTLTVSRNGSETDIPVKLTEEKPAADNGRSNNSGGRLPGNGFYFNR